VVCGFKNHSPLSALNTFEEMTGGGKHEETEENQSFEGGLETEKC